MEDNQEKDETTKPKTANPFLEKLRDNQVTQAREALVKTLVENASHTIGGILDALEIDDDGDYIMLEVFKRMTLEELASAITDANGVTIPPVPTPSAYASPAPDDEDEEDDEEEDDLDDDDEFDDDDDDLDEEEEPKPKKKKKKKSSKKGSDKKSKKKDKKKSKKKDKGGGKAPSKKEILACLRANKARDDDSAMSSKQIRDEVGGGADDVRPLLLELYASDKIDKCGEARGTKYYLA